jgi:RHS repeat-associated protein
MQTHTLGYEDGAGIYINGNTTSDAIGMASPSGQPQPCPVATPCTLTYTYDAKDRLISYGNGRGGSTAYTMIPNGQLKTESYDKGDGTLKYTKTYDYYNPNGIQLKTLRRDQTLPNVTHTQRRFFYTHGDVACVTHDDLDSSGTTVTQADRDRDCPNAAGGTISSRLEESYGYDDLDRLNGYHAYLGGSQTDSGQWTYDALDRVSTEQETHTLGGVNRTASFDYIGLTADPAKEIWTGSGATTRAYSYDAGGNKIGENDSGRALDLLYGYNPHGDVSQLLTTGGAAKAAYGYRPYGDEEAGQNAISQGDTDTQGGMGPINNYRYSAKRFDSANKQINMGARFFSPDYGNFIQEDFLRDALGDLDLATDPMTGSRYALTGGNPVNFVEVDGHETKPLTVDQLFTVFFLERKYFNADSVALVCLYENDNDDSACDKQMDAYHSAEKNLYDFFYDHGLAERPHFSWKDLFLEVSGINDAKRCFGSGKIGSCLWTAAGVLAVGKVVKGLRVGTKLGKLLKGYKDARKMKKIRALGKLGEELAGIDKNIKKTRIPALVTKKAYRIPDVFDRDLRVLGEVKYTEGKMGLNGQMKDYLAYIEHEYKLDPRPWRIVLWSKSGITKPLRLRLRKLQQEGKIVVDYRRL